MSFALRVGQDASIWLTLQPAQRHGIDIHHERGVDSRELVLFTVKGIVGKERLQSKPGASQCYCVCVCMWMCVYMFASESGPNWISCLLPFDRLRIAKPPPLDNLLSPIITKPFTDSICHHSEARSLATLDPLVQEIMNSSILATKHTSCYC